MCMSYNNNSRSSRGDGGASKFGVVVMSGAGGLSLHRPPCARALRRGVGVCHNSSSFLREVLLVATSRQMPCDQLRQAGISGADDNNDNNDNVGGDGGEDPP